ncbi:DUF1540 domain-containing protein [Zhaonella formicivorans]|uniref:DUF1540 domain-containing protein n=1 Tax=Zhaonella formicivorans TaxID=2528593 RepID=UPI0010E9802A|nr:DUF1540 domain-containing protein [Zhaonella formicivorans]
MQGRVERTGSSISRVKCVVNTCQYWDSGNHCNASEIEIQGPNATDTQHTDCATFAPKR